MPMAAGDHVWRVEVDQEKLVADAHFAHAGQSPVRKAEPAKQRVSVENDGRQVYFNHAFV